MFNRDIIPDRRQLMLMGLSLLFTFLPVELGFPRFLKLTNLNGYDWLICIGFAFALILVGEVIKFFLRRRQGAAKQEEESLSVAAALGGYRCEGRNRPTGLRKMRFGG